MRHTTGRVRRRGGVYIAVLGAAMIVSLIGMTALATVRGQRLAVNATADAAKARLYADSAAELAQHLIASDANWRTNKGSGAWVTGLVIGDGTLSVTVTDPIDGNLANRPTDPVTIRGTGMRGNATQIVEATLVASGTPLDALAMALHTAGELHVASGMTLTAQGAPASTNGAFRNQGTVAGSVQCLVATTPGTVTGTLTSAAPSKAMPPSGVPAMYQSLGTAISPGSIIDRAVLGPGVNPWGGGTNAGGVYVITTSSDMTIRRSRFVGTLVIICPGRTVTIQENVFMQPSRADYPALIVDGNLVLNLVSTTSLSESSELTNFNPAGAPYLGNTDSNTTGSYPSEIGGLVHVKGTLAMDVSALVRGAVICESAAVTNAVDIKNNAGVIYAPSLYTSPPMGYTKGVTMAVQPGSWKQVVNP